MEKEQIRYGDVFIAKQGKIIVHPEKFVVATKYTKYLKISQPPTDNNSVVVMFSKDEFNWGEEIVRNIKWIIENYEPVPYKPNNRNRLEEIE